jgi:plasmid replication initiation protein
MLFPFCSTAKAKRVKGIRYVSADGKRWLEVTANYDYGMAKIWDFDILRFALSKAGEIALLIGYFPSYVDFTAYECLKAIGRITNTGKKLYLDRRSFRSSYYNCLQRKYL